MCNSAFNCMFDVSALFVRFVCPIGLLASQTSPWCPMEMADNLPANVTGHYCEIVSSIMTNVHTQCTYYITPAIKIPLQLKTHFTRMLFT